MAKEKAESQVCGSLPWGLCSKSLTDRFSYLSVVALQGLAAVALHS